MSNSVIVRNLLFTPLILVNFVVFILMMVGYELSEFNQNVVFIGSIILFVVTFIPSYIIHKNKDEYLPSWIRYIIDKIDQKEGFQVLFLIFIFALIVIGLVVGVAFTSGFDLPIALIYLICIMIVAVIYLSNSYFFMFLMFT